MRIFIVMLLATILTGPAFAQSGPTLQDKIGAQIGALVISNSDLALQLEQTKGALSAAQVRVKALEDKYEPKATDGQAPASKQ